MTNYSNFYRTGRIQMTEGSDLVNGQDTGWDTAGVEGGVLFIGGYSFPVVEVLGATQLRIGSFWRLIDSPGWQNYSIGLMDSKAATAVWANEQLSEIIARLSEANGIIESLGALELAANKLILATGPDTLGLTDLSPAAAVLLGDEIVPRFGTTNPLHRNNQQNDARFLQIGANGFGGAAIQLTSTSDLNTLPVATAVYRWAGTNRPANSPNESTTVMLNIAQAEGIAAQLTFSNDGSYWIRYLGYANSGAWTRLGTSYEEGTFTPRIEGLTTPGVPSYNQQTGTYVRIGRLVHLHYYMVITAWNDVAGQLRLMGHPFSFRSGTSRRPLFLPSFASGIPLASPYNDWYGFGINVQEFRMYKRSPTNSTTALLREDVPGGVTFYGAASYEAA